MRSLFQIRASFVLPFLASAACSTVCASGSLRSLSGAHCGASRVLHLGTASSIRISSPLRLLRGLTTRSSGPAAARHQGPAGGTLYIFANRALASCRYGPLTSNVRPQMAAATPSRADKCRGSTRTTVASATCPECAAARPAVLTSAGLRENVRCHVKGHDGHHPASSWQPRDCDRPRQDTHATVAISGQRYSPRRSALKVARRPSGRSVLRRPHRRNSQSAVRHHQQARSGPPEEGSVVHQRHHPQASA